jgi:hypothetical protein
VSVSRARFTQSDGEHYDGDGQVSMGDFAADGLIKLMRRGHSMRPIPKIGY